MKKINVKKNLFYCLICARQGSKGIKNKNIKNFHGKPLIYWTFKIAKKIKYLNKVFVSTDSEHIITIAKKNKIIVPFKRPKKLSTDTAKELDVWKHFLKFLCKKNEMPEYFVLLSPTAPLRNENDIILAIQKMKKEKNADVLISITEPNRNPYFNVVSINKDGFAKVLINKKKYFRRQDAPKVYDMTTVVYIFKSKFILKAKNIFDGKVITTKIPKQRSIDIDDSLDFEFAKLLFNKKNLK
ncbi:cytidylyltransferase domain-containing protein [Candidatus Pelagibacter communis]|uniref:acylneuraminate cytidylyltransferase family protein n=1 Tax=Candidatus Pelagibacter TaxID=198251 RepID=UPI003EE0A537